jgi:peptidoglycan/xylan/chitin deacetylase (PgdA/CDA1 family)
VLEWISNVALRTLNRSGAVLCYHSVTTQEHPAASVVHVARQDLVETLEMLHDTCRIIPLVELLQRQQRGQSTKGLLAISFDDAYAGVLSVGEFLGTRGIPVTIFPVGDATVNGSVFWWDRVDDVFPHVASTRWRQFENVCGVPEEYRRGQPESFGPLRPLRQWLLAQHRGRWPERLTPYLAELEHEVHHSTVQRSMTWAEIAKLARQAEVHVGVHTLSHPVLPLLSDADVQSEIAGCFAAVAERSGAPVPVLAAPYGLADERVVRLARATGMLATLSLSGTALGRAGSPDWVPRICMSADASAWRLKLRVAGLGDGLWRQGRAFPVLPSAST